MSGIAALSAQTAPASSSPEATADCDASWHIDVPILVVMDITVHFSTGVIYSPLPPVMTRTLSVSSARPLNALKPAERITVAAHMPIKSESSGFERLSIRHIAEAAKAAAVALTIISMAITQKDFLSY